ncbi:MAG: S8/S53 family peptidase, partial [Acidobacteriota bacterium]
EEARWRQVAVVTGAGNDGRTVDPAHWLRDHANVIVVGALNRRGDDLWRSGFGVGTGTGDGVDLYAPGEDLVVADRWGALTADSGTSYAAPLVSGVVAMVQNLAPTLDAPAVRSLLVETGDKIATSGGDVRRLNAYRAVTCAATIHVNRYAPGHYQWTCRPAIGAPIAATYSLY